MNPSIFDMTSTLVLLVGIKKVEENILVTPTIA